MEVQAFIYEHPKFGKLRGLVIDGDPKFVGIDATDALGYKDAVNALKTHVPDKFKCVINAKILQQMASESKGGDSPLFDFDSPRGLTFISEAGLYKLILRSKLPAAEEFSDWVCEEVLPSIRKHGYYSLVSETAPVVAPEVNLSEEDLLAIYRVYLFLLSDGNIKIGFSKRFCARIGEVKREINRRRKAAGQKELTFKDVYFTPKMSYEDAHLIERCFKEIHSEEHIEDEIFSVDFKKARSKIKYLVKLSVAQLPSGSTNIIADKSS